MIRITIKNRIILGFSILLLGLAISTIVNLTLLSGIKVDIASFRSALDRKAQAVEMDLVMQKVRVRVNQWLRSSNPEFAKQADELLVQDSALVAQMATRAVSDREKQTITDIDRALKAYIESWRVIQGYYAEEAKLFESGIVSPGNSIRMDLSKMRDDPEMDPSLSRLFLTGRDAFVSAEAAAFRYRSSMKAADADEVAASVTQALAALGQATGPLKITPYAPLLARDIAALDAWRDTFKRLIEVGQARSARLSSWTSREGEAMAVGANTLRSEHDQTSSAAQTQVAETIASNEISLYVLSAAIMLVGIALSLALARSISRPLSHVTETLKALAAGNLSMAIRGTERRDEIGEMARAAEVFKDAANEKLRAEAAAVKARDAASSEREGAESIRAERAAQQAAVVESLATALRRLSAGDLTCEMRESFDPEYEQLRTDFNAAVQELRGVIGTIVSNTGNLRSGTTEITQAADDLSRRTEQQAASLEETAAALDEITATVRKTAEGANAVQAVVASAKVDAEHGEAVAGAAVTAMSEIEKSAKEISQIISVIDEIAFQTNLLALNAGVEAARAGDAGRGFAVVASEVRALAQRSAEAAKEIKGLIGASTAHVGRGVTLVRETGAALGRILGQVTQINGAVTDIAASAQEQASGLAEVNTAVNQMDQVTQQNAAMVEQSTAASHSLAQDTAELERLTARFVTDVEQRSMGAMKEGASTRKVSRRTFAKPLRVVSGSEARMPAQSEESWAEF